MSFHTHDNWFFKRLSDGSVHISKQRPSDTFGGGEIIEEHTLDPMSWSSVVSSMSIEGENAETQRAAYWLHMGPHDRR